MAGFIKFSGNKEKAKGILAQATQLCNFMKGRLSITGLKTDTKRLKLSDGSIIHIRIYTDSSYGNVNHVISIYGKPNNSTPEEEFKPLVCYQDNSTAPDNPYSSAGKIFSGLLSYYKNPSISKPISNRSGNSYWYNKLTSCSWIGKSVYFGKYTLSVPVDIIAACIVSKDLRIISKTSVLVYKITTYPNSVIATTALTDSIPLSGNPTLGSFNSLGDRFSIVDSSNSIISYYYNRDLSSISQIGNVPLPRYSVVRSTVTSPRYLSLATRSQAADSLIVDNVSGYFNYYYTITSSSTLIPGSSGVYSITYSPKNTIYYSLDYTTYSDTTYYKEKVALYDFYQDYTVDSNLTVKVTIVSVDNTGAIFTLPDNEVYGGDLSYTERFSSKKLDGVLDISVNPKNQTINNNIGYSRSTTTPNREILNINNTPSNSISSSVVDTRTVDASLVTSYTGRTVIGMAYGGRYLVYSDFTTNTGEIAVYGDWSYFSSPYLESNLVTTTTTQRTLNINTNIDDISAGITSLHIDSTDNSSYFDTRALVPVPAYVKYPTSNNSFTIVRFEHSVTPLVSSSTNDDLICCITRNIQSFQDTFDPYEYTATIVKPTEGISYSEHIVTTGEGSYAKSIYASITHKD